MWQACIAVPDPFSFPSGHACAILSVAYVVSVALPVVAWFLLPIALLVGMSRAVLGVHSPGDVIVGQGLAVLTAHALWLARGIA